MCVFCFLTVLVHTTFNETVEVWTHHIFSFRIDACCLGTRNDQSGENIRRLLGNGLATVYTYAKRMKGAVCAFAFFFNSIIFAVMIFHV
jgi:hypothetical protein